MTHVKQAAVHHRNNYIGTEHPLWGLTAQDNSATRLLQAAPGTTTADARVRTAGPGRRGRGLQKGPGSRGVPDRPP
ncbi:Clp protease N-terminal domain-containing protein [Streptomyces sp. NPDC001948]